MAWLDDRPAAGVAAIFALALGVRLGALALTHRTLPAGDELELFVRAARAVTGPPIEDDAARAPGLLVFYATAFRLFTVHAIVAKLANCSVSALTVVPVAWIGRQVGGARVGVLAALGVALYPTYVAFSHFLWPAPLYILLVTTGVAALLRLAARRGRRALAGLGVAGALLGASALVKESGVFFLPVAALWVVWRGRRDLRHAAVQGAVVALAAAVVVVPWVVHVQRPDLPFALITRTGYMNLFIGNHPQGHGIGMAEYPTLGPTRLEAEDVARERALAEIRRRLPWWPIEKIAVEVPRFFTPTSFAVRRLLMPPGDPGGWGYRMTWPVLDRPVPRAVCAGVVVAAYGLALGLGAAGLVLARRTDATLLFAAFIAAQLLPSIATFAMSRFRLASMTFFIVGAASLLARGRSDWAAATPRRRTLAVACAVALLALAGLDYEAALESTGR
jgi:4-amino-4-deoxy-L-arabinose transferase-like glycosyltransferase